MSNHITKTKVVATLGPSTKDDKVLIKLIETGVDVFRLNFSHGSHEEHKKSIEKIHKINKKLNTKTAILVDLQGPKLRLGELKEESFELKEGNEIIFTTKKVLGTIKKVQVSYKDFAADVKVGEVVKVDDGKIELKVAQIINSTDVLLKTVFGGTVRPRKGINLPETAISVPSLTKKDIEDLEFILQQDISWIALSFVRTANDIIKLRGMIEFKSHPAKIVAKIEKPEAVANLDAIIEASDAIMVARGDLGVEIPVEDVPMVQKSIVTKCIAASKPVIIATQMMESMIVNAVPSRAEITDVANAIFDGADAVMLSGETAVGKHPIKVIETIQKIAYRSEEQSSIYNLKHTLDRESNKFLSNAICYNAIFISQEVGAKAIIATTKSGYTAFALSSFRPKANIYAFTENEELLNTLSLLWGVRAFHYNNFVNHEEMMDDLEGILKDKELLQSGDIVLITGSIPVQARNSTNFIKVSVVK